MRRMGLRTASAMITLTGSIRDIPTKVEAVAADLSGWKPPKRYGKPKYSKRRPMSQAKRRRVEKRRRSHGGV